MTTIIDGEAHYGALVYTNNTDDPRWWLENAPEQFALRLDLTYPEGVKVALVYVDPPSEDEQREIMWQLQTLAGRHGFTLTRTDADGETIDCPPIR